jgi:phage shock protein PspC (stress-responsive transcriptional regulator)
MSPQLLIAVIVLAGLIRAEAGARLILYSPGGKIGERTMKRLHRIAEDRKIAGVCAGLGDYFDLDPVFFRLFFLVSLLFGGLGALAYLILWIMVPEKPGGQGEPRPFRRLHLSNSDRKIGGVCGGLGERLEIDPVLFRVAFILLALACGLGILLYIVLWILIPRAPAVPAVST